MKLAPIFNALYIDVELSNGKIDSADVVAGLWNLKDKTVLDKLVSLDTKQLSTVLNTLDERIKKVPDGLTQIADVDAISEKMGNVEGLKDLAGREVFQSASKGNVPKFIRDKTDFKYLADLKVDAADELLQRLNEFEALDVFDTTVQTNAFDAFTAFDKFLGHLSQKLPLLLKNLEHNQYFSDSLATASILNDNVDDISELGSLFTSVKSGISAIPLTKKDFDIIGTQKSLEQTASLISELNTPADGLSIVPGLGSSSNSSVLSILQDKTLRQILNNGKELDALETALVTFTELIRKLPKIEKQKNVIFEPNNFITIMNLLKVLKDIGSFQELPDQDKFTELAACLTSQKTDKPDELDTILNNFDNFISGLKKIKNTVPTAEKFTTIMNTMTAMYSSLKVYDDAGLAALKKNPNLATLKTALTEMSVSFFKPISTELEQTFYDAVEAFLDTEILDKFQKSEEWISKVLSANSLHREECQFIFQFDVNTLTKLNELPKTLSLVKTQKPIEKLKPFLQAIPQVKSGLADLGGPSQSPKQVPRGTQTTPQTPQKQPTGTKGKTPAKPKRSTGDSDNKMNIKNPEELLIAAHAIKSLDQMNQLNNLEKDLTTVIQKGDNVIAAIAGVSDSRKKAELEKIWKSFPAIKASLTSLKDNTKKALALIKPQEEEKNLGEVGNVYESISGVEFKDKIQLKPLRLSMKLFDAPGHPDVEKALENLEYAASGDWGMAHTNFQHAPGIFDDLQTRFEKFFKDLEDAGKEEGNFLKDNMLYIILGGVLLLVIIGGVVAFFVIKKRRNKKDKKVPLEKDKDYTHDMTKKESIKFSYMQLQDARLMINVYTKGEHQLWHFYLKKDYEGMKKLVRDGCVIDVRCNAAMNRTILHELVLEKNREMCKWFLQKGADQTLHDGAGEDSDTWADAYGMYNEFEYHYKLHEKDPIPRVLPKVPRPWNVLFYDPKCLPKKERKELPIRIRQQCTWGYKPGMDLDSFTHIVLPPKMVKGKDTLLLDNDDLIRYKLLGCWANLMAPEWTQGLIEKQEQAMDEDYDWYVLHCEYMDEKHENTVFNQKTGIHRLRPPLLDGVEITFLETKDKKALAQRKDWEEIIKTFGGKVIPLDKLDIVNQPADKTPYHTMNYEYHEVKMLEQNYCWILKYPDSKPKKEYIEDFSSCNCTDFRFLPECLARFYILDLNNKVVPLAIDEEAVNKAKAEEEAEKKKTESATTSATSNSKSSVLSTVDNKKKRVGKTGKSRESGAVKPKARPAYSLMKAPE
ncbi:unnamed protein product [Caenorhabditis nigoni]